MIYKFVNISESFGFVLHIDYFIIICSIINDLVLGGMTIIPGVVHGPCALSPLSHLIVISDWGLWLLWFTQPVHNFVIISWVINGTLWPNNSPVLVWLKVILVNSSSHHFNLIFKIHLLSLGFLWLKIVRISLMVLMAMMVMMSMGLS